MAAEPILVGGKEEEKGKLGKREKGRIGRWDGPP